MAQAQVSDSTQELLDGISYDKIQDMMDEILGGESFDFGTLLRCRAG
jgi:hypothetical protein